MVGKSEHDIESLDIESHALVNNQNNNKRRSSVSRWWCICIFQLLIIGGLIGLCLYLNDQNKHCNDDTLISTNFNITNRNGTEPNYFAPDGSKFWRQAIGAEISQGYAVFPPNVTSNAQFHIRVEEIWVITAGTADFWRSWEDSDGNTHERVDRMVIYDTFVIPVWTKFQLRTYDENFVASIATSPPWDDNIVETKECNGKWTPTI